MIRRIKASLTVKLFLITALLLTAACAVTYIGIASAVPASYRSALTEELDQRAQALVAALEQTTLADCEPLLTQFAAQTRTDLSIMDAANATLLSVKTPEVSVFGGIFVTIGVTQDGAPGDGKDAQGDAVTQGDVAIVTQDTGQASGSASQSNTQSTTITYDNGTGSIVTEQTGSVSVSSAEARGYPFLFQGTSEPYTLLVTSTMREVNQAREAFLKVLPGVAAAVLIVSLLGSLLYARYVTRPIVKISAISRKLSALDFSWHCDSRRTDEIGVLADSLNALAEHLSAALDDLKQANTALTGEVERERDLARRRSELFAAVSHELKTPVTIIKGQLEGMIGHVGVYADRDAYLARCLAVTESMEALVQEISAIARTEGAGTALSRELFPLGPLVRSCLRTHDELLARKGIAVETDIDPAPEIDADRALIEKAVANLVSNAARYTPESETVRVRVWADADAVRLSIENTGARIPEDALPHLFEAFYRVDASRNRKTGGSGLGLYIVKTILDRHGATYRIANTADGVRAEIAFPQSDHTETT